MKEVITVAEYRGRRRGRGLQERLERDNQSSRKMKWPNEAEMFRNVVVKKKSTFSVSSFSGFLHLTIIYMI